MKADITAHLAEILSPTPDEMQIYLEGFMDAFHTSCEELRADPSVASDFQRLRIITHTMFGYCETMGANDVYAAAKALNTAAKASDSGACKEQIAVILSMYDAYCAEE